jgi:predicted  nucleic acid-binding Zn-ribbon protein
MHPDLEHLDVVDALDRELRSLRANVTAEHQKVADAAANELATAAIVVAALAALEQNRATEKELNRKVERYQMRRTSALRVLEGGPGEPLSAQKQMEQCEAILDDVETEQLEILEQRDTLTDNRIAADAAVEAAKAHSTTLAVQVPAALAKLEARIREATAERERRFGALPRELSRRYTDLVRTRKTAVAHVWRGACSSCRRVVQNQHLADLKRGVIQPCGGCHRWLIPETAHPE